MCSFFIQSVKWMSENNRTNKKQLDFIQLSTCCFQVWHTYVFRGPYKIVWILLISKGKETNDELISLVENLPIGLDSPLKLDLVVLVLDLFESWKRQHVSCKSLMHKQPFSLSPSQPRIKPRLTLLRMSSVRAESLKEENLDFDLNCSLTMNFMDFLAVFFYCFFFKEKSYVPSVSRIRWEIQYIIKEHKVHIGSSVIYRSSRST